MDQTPPVTTELFWDGKSRPAKNKRVYEIFNPARPSELVGYAAAASIYDVDAAVHSAHAAFPAWSALSYTERAAKLREAAVALTTNSSDIATRSQLFTREHGKVLRETQMELSRLGDRFKLTASYAGRIAAVEKLDTPPFDTIITRQSRGVAALIVPWNWPLSILGAKLPQALLAGNTVVIKLPENAALAPTQTLHQIAQLFPPGVLNILTGDAFEMGDALVGHHLVRTINFTGSIPIGRHIMKVAAENLTPVVLELGGNDAAIVLEDADLSPQTFQKMFFAAFATSGQICMAMKRLYVHSSRYMEVVDGLTDACSKAVVGDGLRAETTMGPLNNKKQLNIVSDMLAEARANGCKVNEQGNVPDVALYDNGYFQKPALVLNPEPHLMVVKKEQFGPVLPIIKFNSEQEAVQMANNSEYGLCSSVWTNDKSRALGLARQLEAGYTYINNHGALAQDFRAPFGGFKQSGIGRNLGFEGVDAFMEKHSISSEPGFLF